MDGIMEPFKLSHHSLRSLNNSLRDLFGMDTVSNQPMWKIIWSEDEYEMRETEYSDGGILLLRPEVRLLPKYKQYIQARYILEHLVGIPVANLGELPGQKTSYEPIHTFEDKNGEFLPPKLLACKYIINLVLDAMELARTGRNKSKSFRKFVDEEFSQEASIEAKNKRVMEIQEYLFGDQSALGGTTVNCGQTIIVPKNYGASD